MVVPAGQLRDVLGVREVHYLPSNRHLAVVDHTLSGNSPDAAFAAGEAAARAHGPSASPAIAGGSASASGIGDVSIANFAFTPKIVKVSAGSKVTWRNDDDVPHKIQSADNRFRGSPLLDTKGTYSMSFKEAGEFAYFCSLHPTMQGKIVVTP
jgi:plastocyanin